MKLTTRCRSPEVDGLNQVLLATAVEARVVRTNRVSADTPRSSRRLSCTRPTPGCWPRRSGGSGPRSTESTPAGGAVRTTVLDRSRCAGTKAHGVAAKLRSRAQLGRGRSQGRGAEITGEVAGLTESAINDARRLLVDAQRAAGRARVKARRWRRSGSATRPPGDAAAGWSGRPTTGVHWSKRLIGSSSRPGSGWPAVLRTVPAGWSACTTPRPGRSPRANPAQPMLDFAR